MPGRGHALLTPEPVDHVPEASGAGLAGRSEETGVVCGGGGRCRSNRAGHSDAMAGCSSVSGKCRSGGVALTLALLGSTRSSNTSHLSNVLSWHSRAMGTPGREYAANQFKTSALEVHAILGRSGCHLTGASAPAGVGPGA